MFGCAEKEAARANQFPPRPIGIMPRGLHVVESNHAGPTRPVADCSPCVAAVFAREPGLAGDLGASPAFASIGARAANGAQCVTFNNIAAAETFRAVQLHQVPGGMAPCSIQIFSSRSIKLNSPP